MINSVILMGIAGTDPEVFKREKGGDIVSFNLACHETWQSDGRVFERTHWVRCVAFGRTAEHCSQKVSKGSRVVVQGSLSYSEWDDQRGTRQNRLEVRLQSVDVVSTPRILHEQQA